MEQDRTQQGLTTDTFSTISEEMQKALFIRRIKKMISFIFILVLSSLLLLFFTLPAFQARNMKIVGINTFAREDILEFASIDGYHLNLNLNAEKTKEKIISSSQGFILEAEVENNGFISSCYLLEDHLIGKIDDKLYFASGKTMDEMEEKIPLLPLDSKARERIQNKFAERKAALIPQIHFPLSTSYSQANAFEACDKLSLIPQTFLSYIEGIQFINDSNDSNWSNVVQILMKYEDDYFLVSNLLCENKDKLSKYFSKELLPSNLKKAVKNFKPAIEKKTFSFQDEEKEYSVYALKAIYQSAPSSYDSLMKVSDHIYITPDKESEDRT